MYTQTQSLKNQNIQEMDGQIDGQTENQADRRTGPPFKGSWSETKNMKFEEK